MKLSFLVAGVQKGGTTSLHDWLRQHPGLAMSNTKETHFFDNERIDWIRPDYGLLHGRFAPDDGRPRGESTPITLYWEPAHARIHAYNRDMKFVFLFRDPVLRAFSHWRMERDRGRETFDFADAIRYGRRRVAEASPERSPPFRRKPELAEMAGLSRVFSYVERGEYARQLRSMLRFFPRERMLFLKTDELSADPRAVVARICDFLGVGVFEGIRYGSRNVNARPPSGSVSEDDWALLAGFYRDDLADFTALTGLDISDWPTVRRLAGG